MQLLLPLRLPLSLIRLVLIDFFLLLLEAFVPSDGPYPFPCLRATIQLACPMNGDASGLRACLVQYLWQHPVAVLSLVYSQSITCSSSNSSDRPLQQLIIFSFGPSTLTDWLCTHSVLLPLQCVCAVHCEVLWFVQPCTQTVLNR